MDASHTVLQHADALEHVLLEFLLGLDEELFGRFRRPDHAGYHQQLVAAPVAVVRLGGVGGAARLTQHGSDLSHAR